MVEIAPSKVSQPPINASESARFWPKVRITEQCWLWVGAKDSNGYGRFTRQFAKRLGYPTPDYAHRISYTNLVGQVPSGMELDHLCRNPGCLNPAHLEAVTHSVNILRATSRENKTHCKRGHAYTEENTRRDKAGRKICRVCMKHHMRAFRKGEKLA